MPKKKDQDIIVYVLCCATQLTGQGVTGGVKFSLFQREREKEKKEGEVNRQERREKRKKKKKKSHI